jgi:DNA polymerase III alpha subunit
MFQAHSHNSVKLNNRTLWFDGDSTVEAKDIINNITNGDIIDSLFVEELTKEIVQYNVNAWPASEKISVKANMKELNFDWDIPEEYKSLDIVSYVADKLLEQSGSAQDIGLREQRCAEELMLYRKMGLFDTLKTLIYIINTLIEKNIVWGVGRGSSVSSYVLYVIGVHDVDSFLYNLNIEDFLRTKTT